MTDIAIHVLKKGINRSDKREEYQDDLEGLKKTLDDFIHSLHSTRHAFSTSPFNAISPSVDSLTIVLNSINDEISHYYKNFEDIVLSGRIERRENNNNKMREKLAKLRMKMLNP